MDFTKQQRSIQSFSRERYQTIFVQKTFNIPVSARTDKQRAILQYYRAKSDFHIENGHLCFRGKRVLLKNCQKSSIQLSKMYRVVVLELSASN